MDNQNLNSIQPGNKSEKPGFWKRYWKFIFGFFGIILAVFVGFPIAFNYYQDYKVKKGFEDYFQAEKGYLDALKNDTYGGKTPQETYEMFVETLKRNEILDAAKFYMRDEDRISAYKKFDKMQKDGSLAKWIAELPNWSQMKEVEYWDPDGKEFNYKYIQKEDEIVKIRDGNDFIERKYPAGEYQARIIFSFNKSANIWKIYEL